VKSLMRILQEYDIGSGWKGIVPVKRRNFILLGLTFCAGALDYIVMGSQKATAGPLHIDSTHFAAGGRDVVAYFNLPTGATPAKGVPGSRRFTASWKGGQFAFATAGNRDLFLANPEKYAPQYDGHCAWAAGQGYKALASPDVWAIVDGKLYLNYSHDVRQRWEKGMSSQIDAANANWAKLGQEPGATGDAEDYRSGDAPKS
jgi:hypothetical protein